MPQTSLSGMPDQNPFAKAIRNPITSEDAIHRPDAMIRFHFDFEKAKQTAGLRRNTAAVICSESIVLFVERGDVATAVRSTVVATIVWLDLVWFWIPPNVEG